LSIESIFSKEIGGLEKGRWVVALKRAVLLGCRNLGIPVLFRRGRRRDFCLPILRWHWRRGTGCRVAFFFFFLGHRIPGVGS
jgi:hypothetical protein